MPANARHYRIEHVDAKPRGWRVRTSLSGAHVLRIGYPPGRRHRGAGRLLEVLHPKAESNNPRCQMSEWADKAKANPEELIIFGLGNPARNPDLYEVVEVSAGGTGTVMTKPLQRGEAKKFLLEMRAVSRQGQTGAHHFMRRVKQRNPEESPSERKRKEGETIVGACPHCAKLFTVAEVESGESLKHLSKHRRERFGEPEPEQNPVHMQIEHDPSQKQFRASMPHPRGGSWLYAWGHTKKQAAQALRAAWRQARGNPPNPPEQVGEHRGHAMYFEGISYSAPSLKLYGYRNDLELKRAIDRKLGGKRRAQNYFSETIRKGSDGVVIWANTEAGPYHVTGYVNDMQTIVGERGKYKTLERARKKAHAWLAQHAASKNPRRAGNQSSVYSKAVSLGYPYLRGEGRVAKDGETWLSRVTKTSDGTGAALYVGWSQKTRKWVIEHERGKNSRRRHNPISSTEQAVKLFEIFHGEDPNKITEKHVSAAMRKDYTALGKLVAIGTDDAGYGDREIAQKWDHCNHIDFSDDHVTLASSPDGRQLYAIGGNQNLNGCLEKFAGVDPQKDFIDLGEVAFVVYEARKIHDNFEPVEYVHKFGGHGKTRPGWFYDRLKRAIFFIGGEYFIDIDAKISPGIEG